MKLIMEDIWYIFFYFQWDLKCVMELEAMTWSPVAAAVFSRL